MSRANIEFLRKNLLFRPLPAAGTAGYSAVDESVAGTVLLAELHRVIESGKKIFIVLPRLDAAEELHRQLLLLAAAFDLPWKIELLNEMQRGRFYIAGSESERARVLTALAHGQLDITIASLAALLAPAPAPEALRNSEIVLKCGTEQSLTELLRQLVELDYDDEFEVSSPGEFSHRGGIVDIFSSDSDKPVRIEFFGDEIDSMRYFDPATQRSLPGAVDSYRVINRCTIQTLVDEEGGSYENTVAALAYFDAENMELFELYPDLFSDYFQRFGAENDEQKYSDFVSAIAPELRFRCFGNGEAAPENAVPAGVYPAAAHLIESLPNDTGGRGRDILNNQWQLQLRQWHDCQYRIIAAGAEESGAGYIAEYLKNNDLSDIPCEYIQLALPAGFISPAGKVVVIAENELLSGHHNKSRSVKNQSVETPADLELKLENAVISDLAVGCHAVHSSHGIALYQGLKKVESSDGFEREVMILEYADNTILQVPVHQAGAVSCYIGGGRSSSVKLHRLGGRKWAKDKANTTEAVHQYAAAMLRLQAVRAASPGLPMPNNELAIREFASRFEFAETPDQLRSIEEINADLDAGKPMDRLLCGDVGYGKTEVAMRAAFKAVDAGYQVAMIAPTTVLAQQHYQSFINRFAPYPYTVEVLSRFRTAAEQQSVVNRLRSGGVDIVIGTHRLASADVQFKNLGLVIVDEEQRFGVKVKEQLLQMRADVNVLSMSATPIPRTLYLSMAGARQLSTIMTAPVARRPVKTIVMRQDDAAIQQAIAAEIARGGQIYILHNRVRTIRERCRKLQTMLPDVSFGIAHGQMPEDELEEVMRLFVQGELQVLVCTTIIESGLDVPNANTIIIERADRFGLAELYQLRGRVGRWKRQAYAYMVIPEQSFITADGRKRIAAIRRCTQLGAGMKLALRDLEIRGAGNLLGQEQSGHITTVGFELYCQLLKNEIALLKNEKLPEWLPEVEMSIEFIRYGCRGTAQVLAAGVPDGYIESEIARINIFRTLSRIASEERLQDFQLELADRYGKLPPETENLLALTLLKILTAKAGFSSLTVLENRVILRKRASDTYRINGLLPRLKVDDTPENKLKNLLRIVRLAGLENY